MLFGLAFKNLFRNIRRTAAVLLTVALGSGALFAFEGFINGVLTDYKESTIHAHYGNGQIHTKGYRDNVYKEPWKHWIFDWKKVQTFFKENSSVQHVFPRVPISGMLIHKKNSITGQGQGIDAKEETKFFNALNIEEGRNLIDQENGILLGVGLAKALNVHPGSEVELYTESTTSKISKGKFLVVGIFHSGNVDFDSRVFRIQLKKAQELLKTNRVETISLGLIDHKFWGKISKELLTSFPHLEAASFAELDQVYYQNSVDWLKTQFFVVQIIILLIVLLGIFNTISSSILERKQEIGNLRANGESAFDVMRLIITEGTFLGLIGSLFGLAVTYAIAKGLLHQRILMPPGPGSTRQFFISFYFTSAMTLKTLILSVASSIIASFLAGWKIAKMPIAKALRSY